MLIYGSFTGESGFHPGGKTQLIPINTRFFALPQSVGSMVTVMQGPVLQFGLGERTRD